jgi:hypothetical protein
MSVRVSREMGRASGERELARPQRIDATTPHLKVGSGWSREPNPISYAARVRAADALVRLRNIENRTDLSAPIRDAWTKDSFSRLEEAVGLRPRDEPPKGEALKLELKRLEAIVSETSTADAGLSHLPFSALVTHPEIRAMLDQERELVTQRAPAFVTAPGTRRTFRGKEYEVVERLGGEGNGTVYRLRDAQGTEHALKQYHSTALLSDLAELKSWSDLGVPTVVDQGYEVDVERREVLYRYVHGLTVSELFGSRRLPAEFKRQAGVAYRKWFEDQQGKTFAVRDKGNDIVLDFNTGQFVYIDPG